MVTNKTAQYVILTVTDNNFKVIKYSGIADYKNKYKNTEITTDRHSAECISLSLYDDYEDFCDALANYKDDGAEWLSALDLFSL